MEKLNRLLRNKLIIILLKLALVLPLFSALAACGDEEIAGPRIEETGVDPGGPGDDNESE